MAASFTIASSTTLVNSTPPPLVMPFSVGMWVWTDASASQTFWCYGDTATATESFQLFSSIGSFVTLWAAAGGGSTSLSVTNLGYAAWHYIVARFISATNRRGDGIGPQGQVVSAQSTVSRNPSGLDTIAFGAQVINTTSAYFGGKIAEYWCTDTDVYPPGAMDPGMLRQLAYKGPFSVAHVAANLIEYRSFRRSINGGGPGDVYWGKYGEQRYTNNNGVSLSNRHPSVLYSYRKPNRDIWLPSAIATLSAGPGSIRRRRLLVVG